MAGLGKQKRGTGIARVGFAKGSFPDLNKDGEITKADVLKGRTFLDLKKVAMLKICLKNMKVWNLKLKKLKSTRWKTKDMLKLKQAK
jgi:hypothetical protein